MLQSMRSKRVRNDLATEQPLRTRAELRSRYASWHPESPKPQIKLWLQSFFRLADYWQNQLLNFSLLAQSLYTLLSGNPLQCSCLENPRDRGAWWAAVYRVTQSRTRLKRLSSSSSKEHQTWPYWLKRSKLPSFYLFIFLILLLNFT